MEVARRPNQSPTEHTGPPVNYEALETEAGFSRRRFLNRALWQTSAFIAAAWGTSVLGFLWPRNQASGFGSKVNAGNIDAIRAEIAAKRAPVYVAEARAYVSPFPKYALDAARAAHYPHSVLPVLEQGVIVQSQTCPHLGCRVTWCDTSQWFECPCHGSKYNRVGEKRSGPAPRGMSLVETKVENGELIIESGTIHAGLPLGTDTTGQKQEGRFCFKQ